jgi:hypothetical protein
MRERTGELASIAQEWFDVMRESGEDVCELMHDGCPVACVGDAPFGYVNAFNAHVNIGFFHGASLKDAARLLQGAGKVMRHVKARPGELPDEGALKVLIQAAYADIKMRRAAP